MRKLHFIFGALLALAGERQVCAQTQRPSLLPSNFGSWTKGTCSASTSPVSFGKETLVQDASDCAYANGAQTISVTGAAYGDPTAAYQIYTSGLHPGMMPSFVANNSAVDGDDLWLLTGNVVVRVKSQKLASEDELKLLVKSIEGHVDHTPLPPIRSYLPEYGLVSGTQRYALGPLGFQAALKFLQREEYGILTNELGFNIGAETMLAAFKDSHNSGVLLLVEYPTPQLAEQHWKHLESALEGTDKKSAVIERKGSLLSLVLTPSSEEFAKSLRKSVNYETQVTWNEPSQTLTDPPFMSTIAKIFLGTGVFMVVALALGVAFGGVRLIIKRLFPGKVFDRPQDIEVLQMGLSGKKIDPTDMY
jgi:Family of unknown function (DUF6599)